MLLLGVHLFVCLVLGILVLSCRMGLRDVEATLPPGFRFCPSDEELVCHYLYKKVVNERLSRGTLVEIDLHTCEPWELPGVAYKIIHEFHVY